MNPSETKSDPQVANQPSSGSSNDSGVSIGSQRLGNAIPAVGSPERGRGGVVRRVVLGTSAAVVLGFVIFGASHPRGDESKKQIPVTARPVPGNGTEFLVRTYAIPDASVRPQGQRAFTGTLQARYQSALGFRIGGKVIARHVETGDRVRQGELLMQLDPEDAALQLEVAKSDLVAVQSILQQAEAEETRLVQLRASGAVSRSDYDVILAARDTARARWEAAQRRLHLAENQLSYCDLKADSDGLVTQLLAEVGQVVGVGQPVIQWVQGDELEAVVSIPETIQHAIKDQDVEISFWSRPGERFEGRLRELSPVANPQSRTYDARFQLSAAPADLALGMTATVHLLSKEWQGIPIPMSALAEEGGTPCVWKLDHDGSVTPVPVAIIKFESGRALVRGNLYAGDEIVSAGVQRLDRQSRVRAWRDVN